MGLRIFGFREFAKTLPGAASAWVWRRPEASLFAENHAVCWDPSAERQGQGGSPGSRNCRGPPAGAGVPRVTPCALAICKLCRQGRGGRIDPLRQPGRKPRRGQQRGLVPYGPHRPPRPLGSPRPCRPIGAPKTARIACWTRRCRRIAGSVKNRQAFIISYGALIGTYARCHIPDLVPSSKPHPNGLDRGEPLWYRRFAHDRTEQCRAAGRPRTGK